MKKIILCALAAFLAITCFTAGVLAQESQIVYVRTFDDIEKAIRDSAKGATVNITLLNNIPIEHSEIYIHENRTVNLYGAGFTLERDVPNQIIKVEPGATLNLHNVTLDGSGKDDCGPLANVLGKLTATDVTFKDNHAVNNGGAIYVYGGTLSLSRTNFSGNKAQKGGAVYAFGSDVTIRDDSVLTKNSASIHGGAVCIQGGSFNFFSSEMSENSASKNGGAAYFYGVNAANVPEAEFNSAVVTKNTAENGAGIYSQQGKVNLTGACGISENTASSNGGGIYADGSSTVYMGGSTSVNGNTAQYGGGLWMKDGTFKMHGSSVIEKNTANDAGQGQGGGAYLMDCDTVMAQTSSIRGNTTEKAGGGAFISRGTFLMKEDSLISGNSVTKTSFNDTNNEGGGGVYLEGEMTMSDRAAVSNNTCKIGGGLRCGESGTRLIMKGNSKVSDNKSTGGGGSSGGGVEIFKYASLDMSGYSVISGNTNASLGGGLYIGLNSSAALSDSARISGNSAGMGGGAIIAESGALTLAGSSSVQNNTASDEDGGGGIYMRYYTSVTLSGSPRVTGNTSSGAAADNCRRDNGSFDTPMFMIAGNLYSGANIGVTHDLDKTDFRVARASNGTTNYTASAERFYFDGDSDYIGVWDTKDGKSGVYFTEKGHPVLVYNAQGDHPSGDAYCWSNLHNVFNDFVYNNKNKRPSGFDTFSLRFLEAQLNVTETWEIRSGITLTLTGERITTKMPGDGEKLFTVKNGGTLILDAITIDAQSIGGNNSTIINVEAGGKLVMRNGASIENSAGSGVNNHGEFIIENGSVSGCHYRGIHNSGTATLKDGAGVAGNSGFTGGGIYNAGTIFMQGGSVRNNTSDNNGAGIYNTINGTLTITGGTISDNTAAQNGGGVYNIGAMAVPEDGYIIVGSNKAISGGGIYSESAISVKGQANIHSNTAIGAGGVLDEPGLTDGNGGGVYLTGAHVSELSASTELYFNTAYRDGAGLYAEGGTLTVKGVTYQNNAGRNGGGLCARGETLTVSGNTYSNTSGNQGGGVYANEQSTLTITGDVYNNTATEGYGEGGGVYAAGVKKLEVTGGVYLNKALNRGGGLYTSGNTIISGDVYNNSTHPDRADGGGGIFVNSGDTEIRGNVYGNSANSGGGIYRKNGTLTLYKSGRIYNNTALSKGGGLYVAMTSSFSTVTAYNVITGNRAGMGGGIYSGGELVLSGSCDVTGNTSDEGGGVYFSTFQSKNQIDGSLTLSDSGTVWNNHDDKGAPSNLYIPDTSGAYPSTFKPITIGKSYNGRVSLRLEKALPTGTEALTVAEFDDDDAPSVSSAGFAVDGDSTKAYMFSKTVTTETDPNITLQIQLTKRATEPGDNKTAVDIDGTVDYKPTFDEAMDYINRAVVSNYAAITLLDDQTVSKTAAVPNAKTLTVNANGYTLTRAKGFSGSMFSLGTASLETLNLENITLDGAEATGDSPLVQVIKYGDTQYGILTANNVTIKNGNGAAIENNGVVELSGNTVIAGNKSGVSGTGTLKLSGNVSIKGNADSDVIILGNDTIHDTNPRQTVILTGAFTGEVCVKPTQENNSRYTAAVGEGADGYVPGLSDAEHFSWNGTQTGAGWSFTRYEDKVVYALNYIKVDGKPFATLYDAFNYVNTDSLYASGREANVTVISGYEGKKLFLNYSNMIPSLAAGRAAVLTDGGNEFILKRGTDYLKTENMIKVSGKLTLAGSIRVENENTDNSDDVAPAILVNLGAQLIMTDSAKVTDNNQGDGDSVLTGGVTVVRDSASIGTITVNGSLSASGNAKINEAFLPNGKTVSAVDGIKSDADIRVNPATKPVQGSPVTVAENVATATEAGRFSPTGFYTILYDADAKTVKLAADESEKLTVSPAARTFDDLLLGEKPRQSLTFKLSNRSANSLKVTYDPLTDFELVGMPESIAPGASAVLTVTPKENLPIGSYNETILFKADGGLEVSAEVFAAVKLLPFDISELETVTVDTQPKKLTYRSGSKLDLSGLTITLTGSDGKSVTGTLEHFKSLNPTASPAEGTRLYTSDSGKPVTVTIYAAGRPFEARTENLFVYLPETTYRVTVTGGSGSGLYPAGATVTLTAEEAEGKRFYKWEVVSGDVTLKDETNKSTAFVMPAQAVEVKALFKDVYQLTVTDGKGSGLYAAEETVTVTANEPVEGMRFDCWKVVSGNVTLADAQSPTATFAMPAGDAEIAALFTDYKPITRIETIDSRETTVGSAIYPAVELTPSDARLIDIKWESSDESVATVDRRGLVRALKPGETVIKGVSGKNPDVGCQFTLTVVKEEGERQEAYSRRITLVKGKKVDLAKRYGNFYAWTSDDKSIASVNKKGVIKAKKIGETIVRGVLGKASAKSAVVGDEIEIIVKVVKNGAAADATAGLELVPSVRTQKIGEAISLSVRSTPADMDLTGLTWESADETVATVDKEGLIIGVSAGETTVTARLGDLSATAWIIVEDENADETLTLTVDMLAIAKGRRVKLGNLSGFKGSWSVADAKIAEVSAAGTLKTKKPGDTVLTFTVASAVKKGATFMEKSLIAGDSVQIALKVTKKGEAVTKVKVKGDKEMATGETQKLTASLTPKNPAYPKVFWRSSAPYIVSVDKDGNITALQPGKATITATATSAAEGKITVKVR